MNCRPLIILHKFHSCPELLEENLAVSPVPISYDTPHFKRKIAVSFISNVGFLPTQFNDDLLKPRQCEKLPYTVLVHLHGSVRCILSIIGQMIQKYKWEEFIRYLKKPCMCQPPQSFHICVLKSDRWHL